MVIRALPAMRKRNPIIFYVSAPHMDPSKIRVLALMCYNCSQNRGVDGPHTSAKANIRGSIGSTKGLILSRVAL